MVLIRSLLLAALLESGSTGCVVLGPGVAPASRADLADAADDGGDDGYPMAGGYLEDGGYPAPGAGLSDDDLDADTSSTAVTDAAAITTN